MANDTRGETFVMHGPGEGALSFTAFLMGLAASAFIHLGERPDPETGRTQVTLPLAKQTLDLLLMLREKTRGNLTAEEEKLFGSLLAELQLRFVEAAQRS